MGRTTIRLPDRLLAQVKQAAVERGSTITAVIADALRQALLRRERPRASASLPLYRPKRPGLQPGVQIDDTAALLDLMDQASDPRRR